MDNMISQINLSHLIINSYQCLKNQNNTSNCDKYYSVTAGFQLTFLYKITTSKKRFVDKSITQYIQMNKTYFGAIPFI